MKAINAWIKAQSPAVQSFIYAVETGLAAAASVFLGSLYVAFTGPHGLAGFDWHGQIYTLEMGAGAAIVKAILDALKGTSPTQVIGGSK